MSINRVNISGNLTRDPELKTTTGGTSVLTFGVAVNDRRKNPQTGEWEDVPNYVDCVVFGSRAEPLSRFLSKGSKVAIDGKLRWSSWERDGERRSKLEVITDEVEFLSPRGDGQAPQAQASQQQYVSPQQYQQLAQQTRAPQQQQFYPNQAPMGYQQQYAQPTYSVPQQPAQQELYADSDIPY